MTLPVRVVVRFRMIGCHNLTIDYGLALTCFEQLLAELRPGERR